MGRTASSRTSKPPGAGPGAAASPLLRLIEAAEDIFLAKGYHTATMNDVAQAAGMSKKTVYMLIKSKAELFGLLLAHHESLLKFPDPHPDWTVRDTLYETLSFLAQFLISPEQIAILRLIMAEYTQSPNLGKIFHKRRVLKAKAKLHAMMKHIALSCGKAPEELNNKELEELSAMLFGMALGEFHLSVLVGFRAAPARRRWRRGCAARWIFFSPGAGMHRRHSLG